MANDSRNNLLLLTNHDGLGRIAVDLESFFEFSFWMAEELEDLVATHRHLAAQQADRRHSETNCPQQESR